jgi:hypothetical protein
MPPPQSKIDLILHAYSKNWLKSLERARPSTSLGFYLTGMFVFLWASALTVQLGYNPGQPVGGLFFVGIGLGLAITAIFANKLLARTGIDRPTRSALWLGALVGPYVSLAIEIQGLNPTTSHLAGFGSAVFLFWLSIQIDKLVEIFRKPTPPPQGIEA